MMPSIPMRTLRRRRHRLSTVLPVLILALAAVSATPGGASRATTRAALTGPTVAFTLSTPSPAAGSRVVFADTSGGSPTTWSWDFGDGGHSAVQNPAHTYGAEGTYTVRLTASNASGTSSATSVVTVTSSGVLRLNAAHSFDVTLTAHDQRTGADGSGVVIGQNDVYGYFSLPSLSGNAGNPEVIVKMVDASGIGQNYWVFYGTMTDLEYTISVKENATGIVKQYSKNSTASGQFDTSGFPTPTPTPPSGQVTEIVISTKAWEFSPGGSFSAPLVVQVGVPYRLRFHNVDPPGTTNPNHGFTGIAEMGISGTPTSSISPGRDYVTEVFTPQPFDRGSHPFACTNDNCGGDPQQHTFMVGQLVVQ
jgi:PKD repeat protein